MTVETQCYVCGVQELCPNGLCAKCAMKELFSPGAAFAATFGSLNDIGETLDCPLCNLPGERTPDGVYHCQKCEGYFEDDGDMWWEDEAATLPEQPGFFMNVDGVAAHVLGDPDMPPESRNAVENLIRAAVRYVEDQQPIVSWWSD